MFNGRILAKHHQLDIDNRDQFFPLT